MTNYIPPNLILVVPLIPNRDATGKIVSYRSDFSDLGVSERVAWDIDQVEAAANPPRSNIGQIYAMRAAIRHSKPTGAA